MPLRSTALTEAGTLKARVTLENLRTGEVVELRDSLFRFDPSDGGLGSDGVFLHNYWTTLPIEPGASYRFRAVADEARPAEATIEVPPDYDVEVWIAQPSSRKRDLIRLDGLRYVAFTAEFTYVIDGCGPAAQRTEFDTGSPQTDVQMISIGRYIRNRPGCGVPELQRREIWIVGSAAEWPAGVEYSPTELRVPDSPSNITNALGFLGGVLTKRVPYENCAISVQGDTPDYCRLHYDENTATLTGTVRDVLCSGDPIREASVELREVTADPMVPAKVRFTSTSGTGEFSIGGLEADRRYSLSVRRFSLTERYDQYHEYLDTLTFAPGEKATYDVALEPWECKP